MDTHTTNLRLLLPESIWLESEQIEQATAISRQAEDETHQWQAYLNALARLGLEQWLHERLPEQPVHREMSEIGTDILQVGEFKLCLLVTEHVLDEVIPVPQAAIDQPGAASHFYIALEVIEEQDEVIIRGFLRHDQLIDHHHGAHLTPVDNDYLLPLSVFDAELSHLLFYCRLLEPATIPLSTASNSTASNDRTAVDSVRVEDRSLLQQTKTKLSHWLQGAFDEAWQAVDTLINPGLALALSTRVFDSNIKRGKLINLGMQLADHTLVLLVIVTPETEGKLAVLVQLHPTGSERVLPSHVKLRHYSRRGNTLQEVESRLGDNYIQLRSFKGEPGKRFSIEVSLGEVRVKEDFEL